METEARDGTDDINLHSVALTQPLRMAR